MSLRDLISRVVIVKRLVIENIEVLAKFHKALIKAVKAGNKDFDFEDVTISIDDAYDWIKEARDHADKQENNHVE